ncbi:MAG TPA: FecR domain-containing protein [Steroidobacteraceae bacterium]|jgi:transmembrane sensor|nr:FecR domain-containing protein [Steroidobacteraceae bacterium]
MTDRGPSPPFDIARDPAHLAAADWLVRLQSTAVSIEDTLAWQAWMRADATHARAFARLEELSQVLRNVPAPSAVSARQFARDRYDASVPIRDWKQPRAARTWAALAVVSSAVAASFAVFLSVPFWKTAPPANSFATLIGETRNVALADGSTITLGGDTRIEVALSDKERNIELTKGEALFVVAKDAARPFKVHAGDATVVAVGTAFNVERDSDRSVVSVTEGRVVVEPVTHFLPAFVLQEFKPKLRSVRLNVGQQTTAGSAGIEEPTKMVDAATGWQIGHLAFHLQPLRYVLEDVNRYARKPIVLENEHLGELMITGTVERGNITGWVKSLERAFDLQATEDTDQITLSPR